MPETKTPENITKSTVLNLHLQCLSKLLGQISGLNSSDKTKKAVHINICPEMSGLWVLLKVYIQQ